MKSARVALMLLCLLAPIALMGGAKLAHAEDADDTVEGVEDVLEDEVELDDVNEVDEDEVELADLGASEDVETYVVLPYHHDKSVAAGSIVTAFVGVHNRGESPFLFKGIDGAVYHPSDANQIYQNYTLATFDSVVDAGAQVTFEYKFRPSERFEPRDLGLVIRIFYADAQEAQFADVAFNETIAITDAESELDAQTIFVYVILAAAAVLGAVVFQQQSGASSASSASSRKVETGTTDAVSGNAWLQNTAVTRSNKKKRLSSQ